MRPFLLLTLCLGLAGLSAAPAAADTRPNVLFIVADDLNDWVGCLNGHPQARTPHLDRLAARGMLFANAHIQTPLCNPSRASVLTGLRPTTTGIYGLAPSLRNVDRTRDAVTLPQYFRQHGCFTATFGKVHHDGTVPPRWRTNEFDVWGIAPGPLLPKQKLVNTPHPNPWVDWGVFPEKDEDQMDLKVADAAIAQLDTRPTDKPFFLCVGFRLPHVPCFVSQKWFDLFPPEPDIILPPYLKDDRADVPDFAWYLHWKLPEPRLSWLQANDQWRPLVRAYLASTTFMDAQVGRLLDALEARQLATNTIVVFWSDHGWHLGEKDITGKNTLWERSTRVPLIFAGPGIARGVCGEPVELLDLYPTLVQLCGLPEKTGLEGHSLAPQLKDAQARRPWPAITTHNAGNHAVRSAQWRYIRYADGSQELYDLRADPNEWTNRVHEPSLAGVVREHARWLPATEAPLAPGSAHRVLTRTNDVWYWEGVAIEWSQLEN